MFQPKIYIASHHDLVKDIAESLNWKVVTKPDLCTIHWKQERLRDAISQKGYTPTSLPPAPAHLQSAHSPPPSLYLENCKMPVVSPISLPSQRTSVIPGLGQAVTKDALNSSLEAFSLLMGKNTLSCSPKTFCLPSQSNALEEHLENSSSMKQYIYKPSCGSQGKGIHIFTGLNGWKELKNKIQITSEPESGRLDPVAKIPRSVVQVYVNNPYLKLGGLKFDFRLYVLVESLDPLSIWLCDEGLVRFCTIPYSNTRMKNKKMNMCQHLSNYSINKNNTNGYVHSSILDPNPKARSDGTKRTLTSVLSEMKDLGENVEQMMNDIQHLIVQTSAALQSEIILRSKMNSVNGKSKYSNHLNKNKRNLVNNNFQVLGFDVMIDENLKPYLLEVNANPSLCTTYNLKTENIVDNTGEVENSKKKNETVIVNSPVDKYIKEIVVKGALLIVSNNHNDVNYCYTNLNANASNVVRRASWITSRVRRFYERLCRGRRGLPCNIFCRSLRSILRLRGALVSTFETKDEPTTQLKLTGACLRPVKKNSRKRVNNHTDDITLGPKNSKTNGKRRPISARRRRPVSAGRLRNQNKSFEAGELFLLFARCVGERMTKGYTTLNTTMDFCQFVPALVTLAKRQYPNCPDAVTSLDTLLAEAEDAERQANETLITSVASKSYSLGHLIVLKDMIENNKKKQKLKVIEKELNQKLIEKRKIITKTRLDKRRQEELLHHKRRIEHEARLKKLQIKSKKEMDEKRRRQLEFKLWMATGGK